MPYHVKLGELYQKEKIYTKVPHEAYGGTERERESVLSLDIDIVIMAMKTL